MMGVLNVISDFLIDSSSRYNLQIINLIYMQPDQKITKKEISNTLKMSEYKLSIQLNSLSLAVETIFGDQETNMRINLRDVQLIHFDSKKIQLIQLYFLKNSNRFKVLHYLFFQENIISRNKFLRENFLSQANYYTIRREVENNLNKTNFPSANLSIITNHEFIIRRELTSFYYEYFDGLDSAFPEFKKISREFVHLVEAKFKIKLSPRQIGKLKVFIEIQFGRMKNRNFLFNIPYDIDSPIKQNVTKTFMHFYKKHVSTAEEKKLDSEINYLLLFLYSQNIVDTESLPLDDRLNSAISKMINYLHRKANKEEQPIISKLTNDEWEILKKSLTTVTINIFLFDMNMIKPTDQGNHTRLQQTFPIANVLTIFVCKTIVKYFKTNPTIEEKEHLLYNYLMAVILGIPKRFYSFPMDITIDFSNNSAFHSFIVKFLEPFHNIKLNHTVNDDTDLYLTDHYTRQLDGVKQIIWPNPLSQEGITNLRAAVENIQQKKINEHGKSNL